MIVRILKFGGSSFRNGDDYNFIASHIVKRLSTDADRVVVIVSAMYGVTDSLRQLALSVSERCGRAALDAVLTSGEVVSVGLLEAALEQHSVAVSALFGYSLGVRVSSGFNRASIESINRSPLRDALETSQVVIIAGAQGVDRSGRISMLGRNSSDLTAVIAADIVGSGSCEIYSDVCGVYTADPQLVKGARLIPEISHTCVSRMARHGAKVLHYGALEYASSRGIVITCKSLRPQEVVGTHVAATGDVATVVVNPSATRLDFNDRFEWLAALRVLEELDITWVGSGQNVGGPIYLSHDANFALGILAERQIKLLHVSKRVLVSEITSDVTRINEFHDLSSAVSCAQKLHADLYPEERQLASGTYNK
ncbi:uridylate kinase [Microvirga sp. KLBC 81]|uniref:amino acid kinase family protein n=1 Tax=Microvirga sp. KLBC 81 TaxID=1862707 RepID=UPI000D5111C5|nr:uridylate kinase [Microvirga sp. KLBC 81]PVE20450.1 uridylate kinase [Microvirga sp. KLBC 81]